MPVTVAIMLFICEMGMFGSAGAAAWIVTMPVNPLHCAIPLGVMLGWPDAMGEGFMDMDIGIGDMEDVFTVQSTGGDITVIGAMLNVPVAVNCTCPLAKF